MSGWIWAAIGIVFLSSTGIFICYLWISLTARPYIYHKVENLPPRDTSLLLGTARLTKGGNENLFFSYRIDKSAQLYQLKKTSKIILSGADKAPQTENEVTDMLKELVRRGVSPADTINDNQGYRTWASVWRCKHIYHTTSPVIVSQKFHNQRAVFIALRMEMTPIAVNAKMVKGKARRRIIFREAFARVKCILDCYLLHPTPDS